MTSLCTSICGVAGPLHIFQQQLITYRWKMSKSSLRDIIEIVSWVNSSVSYIYCWYLIYGRLKLLLSPMGDLLVVAIVDDLLSHWLTASPVAKVYRQLANSPHWCWYTVVVSYGWAILVTVQKRHKQYYCHTDELVSHSKSTPMATDKLVGLHKSSETVTYFIGMSN